MGQRVGKFEIIAELGRGGMGVVYKAADPGIERTVALKVLPPSHTQDAELRERFLREARAAGRLQHPNIVVIHEIGEDQGNLYIAMEYLEGETLAERIARERGRGDVASALEVMAQVGRGLHYAHERGVVHRDIKPANILVTREGTAKILDFGIARAGDKRMTKTGQVMGTIYYMSPEQINGQQLDGRSDIFSAGIVLYELLTGDVPFDEESTGATMMKILTAPAPPLGERAPMSPPVLEEIVGRALAKEPKDRYANAGEFAAALEAAKAQCAPTRPAAAPTRPAKAMAISASAEMATVLHQEKPAPSHIELEEFKGWKEDAPSSVQPEIHANAAAASPAVAREPSGPQTIIGESGWKWWHLFWPSGTSPTAGKVGCRFSAGAAFLFALLSLFVWFVQTVDTTQADHPDARLFFGAYGVGMAFCAAFLLRYSRIGAAAPALAELGFAVTVVIKGNWKPDFGPNLFLALMFLVYLPGIRGSLLYHRLQKRAGVEKKTPLRRVVIVSAVGIVLGGGLVAQYYLAKRAADDRAFEERLARHPKLAIVAGNGVAGTSGDGGPAEKASLELPSGLAYAASADTLYVADCYGQRIRAINTSSGMISTVAGSGSSGEKYGGFEGDGGPPLAARFDHPCAIAVDSAGNLYVADGANHRVRKIDVKAGTVTTIAGSGPTGVRNGGYSGDSGPAVDARLNYPNAILVTADDGSIYIADTLNHRVRYIDPKTGIIGTIAGTGTPGFSGDGGKSWDAQLDTPQGLALDSSGNLYIGDNGNRRIRKVTPDGTITTFAGTGEEGTGGDGGPATKAQFMSLSAIVLDGRGNLFVADYKGNRVRRIDAETGLISPVAGDKGPGGAAAPPGEELNAPSDLALDNHGNLYIADARNHFVRKVSNVDHLLDWDK